jgi:predicted permease
MHTTDLRHVLRGLRRSPGFVAAAVVTLAVGIAANVTVFALIDAVLFRPLSTVEPERLVRFGISTRGSEQSTRFAFAYSDYRDIASGATTLDDVTASALTPFVMRADEASSEILGEVVSGDYFPMLHITTARGRLLTGADDEAGAAPAAVISRRAEGRHFAGREALGATIFLNGQPYTVVGIAPPAFGGTFIGTAIDAWVPLETADAFFPRNWRTSRAQTAFSLLGRLTPEATREQAQRELDAIAARAARLDPASRGETRFTLLEGELLRGRQRQAAAMFALILAGLVGLVLLIVCANVANLLLARGIGLRRQMAIRLALGAGRSRLMALVMAESFVLSALGGAGALAIASGLIGFLSTFNPLPTLSLDFGLRVDNTVMFVAAALALVTGILLGVVPAMHASAPDLQSSLREESSAVTGGRGVVRLRSALVVAQVAVSLLLLSAAGLFGRSLVNARQLDLGFNPEGAMAIDVDLAAKNRAPAEAHRLFDELARRLRARPDVTHVAFSNRAPVDTSTPTVEVIVGDQVPVPGRRAPEATMYSASPEYFDAVGVSLVHGRPFRDDDALDAPRVAIVNETMARRFWDGADAIGRRFRTAPGGAPIEIVGIARDSRYRSLGETSQPHVYLPFAQSDGQSATVIVSSPSDPRPLLPVVQRELTQLSVPLEGFFGRTLRDHLAIYLLPSELAASMAALLGAVAMLVAAVGLYGVIAYMVTQRRAEIAVRMALGASPRDIRALVLGGGVRLLLPGLTIGLLGAVAAGRLASGVLYGVGSVDPLTMTAAAVLLAAVVMTASYLPARKAMMVDPASALRR